MKPREIAFAAESYPDRFTGRRVTRLFPKNMPSCHAYFTSTSYDAAGRLIITAQVRNQVQLVRLDMKAAAAHVLTDLPNLRMQSYIVVPSRNIIVSNTGRDMVRIDLETGEAQTIFTAPEGWTAGLPTADASGKRMAFVMAQEAPKISTSARIYSGMAENFYYRPHCMVVTIDLESNVPSVVWGESAWISHVLINPVDPDIIVFCHEGGGYADHRLWVVDAKMTRKKKARCLYVERDEEFLVHEYFVPNGVLGVQYTEYDPADETRIYSASTLYNGALFLNMDGSVAGKYKLPGRRSGHIQSNADNSLLVSDGYFPSPDWDYADGQRSLSLHVPKGGDLTVERLCYSGTSWKTQASHPHPIFSPDEKQILFSAENDGVNGTFLVDLAKE